MKKMKEAVNATVYSIICSSILVFIIGLLMVIFPKVSIETMGMVAAIYIIAYGIVLIYLDIKASKYYVPFDGLFSGIVSILMGILLLCKPGILPVVFTVVIGIWMILSSINYIKLAIKLSKTKLPWVEILLLGILDLIAGIIVLLNPFTATMSLTLFAGIMLMIHSVINIVDMIIIKKDAKEITKALDEEIKNAIK